MKKVRVGILALVAVAAFTSCKKGTFCYKGDGNITTETRDISGFSEITMSTSGTVYIEESSEYSVQVETSSNLLDVIETEVHGSTLEIDTKRGKCLKGNTTLNVYVTAPSIEGLVLSGSGRLITSGLISSNSMDVVLSGSGDISIDSLETTDFEATISGSGNISAFGVGTALKEKISISGSGNLNTLNLPAQDSEVSISGSGDCNIHVTEALNASISGSGNVIYKGSPAVTSNVSGSGTIRPY
jgi:hypothetical protein